MVNNNPYTYPYIFFNRGNSNRKRYSHPNHQMYGVPFTNVHSQQVNAINYQKVPVENILQNPLQPFPTAQQLPPMYPMYQHPYPKPPFPPTAKVATNPFISSFKNKDGTINMNKMLDTAGLMLNAVNQVSSLIKGLGGVLKA